MGKKLLNNSSPILASYNYDEIADGTGIKTYYGVSWRNTDQISVNVSSGETSGGILTANITYTKPINYIDSASCAGVGTWTTIGSTNYDLSEYTTPKIIKGQTTIHYAAGATNYYSASYAIIADLIKVDKLNNENVFATISGAIFTPSGSMSYLEVFDKWEIPQTHFKIGEKLRLKMKLIGKGTSAAKPLNPYILNYASGSGALFITIPYKLEV